MLGPEYRSSPYKIQMYNVPTTSCIYRSFIMNFNIEPSWEYLVSPSFVHNLGSGVYRELHIAILYLVSDRLNISTPSDHVVGGRTGGSETLSHVINGIRSGSRML